MVIREEVLTFIKVLGLLCKFINQRIIKHLRVIFRPDRTAKLSRLNTKILTDEVDGIGGELQRKNRFRFLNLRFIRELFEMLQSRAFQAIGRYLVTDLVQHFNQREEILVGVGLHFLLAELFVLE